MSTPIQTPPFSPDGFTNVTATPPKKRRRWPWVLLGVGGTFAVLMGGCAALLGTAASQIDDAAAEVAEGGISNGVGTQDATADIGTPTMEAPDTIGSREDHDPGDQQLVRPLRLLDRPRH